MNLGKEYSEILHAMPEDPLDLAQLKATVATLVDLTLLKEVASISELQAFFSKANQHNVAAICILPHHLPFTYSVTGIKKATVINFPSGEASTKEVLSAIDNLISNSQIDEIDYVFPYRRYLQNDHQYALAQCKEVYALCSSNRIILKVILETGAFANFHAIYQLSYQVLLQGCDFLKTSTGRFPKGANPIAAFAMLKAIKDTNPSCGIKVSGGITQPKQAFTYMQLAQKVINRELDKSWFRIGTSSLLEAL
jgi:deoxyribose-phosphate aldolase